MRHRTALLAVAGASLAAAPLASAHADLMSTSPAAGSTVATAPRVVLLNFEGVVGKIDGVTVVNSGVNRAASVKRNPKNSLQIRVTLTAKRPAGTYTVRWKIRSADGHKQSGTFAFRAKKAAS